MKKKILAVIAISALMAICTHTQLHAQVLNTDKNIEVHFLQGFGFINIDNPGAGNFPEQTFISLVANDTDNQATTLLDHSSGGSNPTKYCYNMAVSTNSWGPEVDVNLATILSQTGKFDFDVFSWEEDVAVGECVYTTTDDSPGFKVVLVSPSDSVVANTWRTDTLDIPNSPNPSKARFKYAWRYANGERTSPLDFGVLTKGTKTHINNNLDAPTNADAQYFGYKNDWNNSTNSNFQNANDVTYTFEVKSLTELTLSTISTNTNFDTYIHLVKLDNAGNYQSYEVGNNDFVTGFQVQSQVTSSISPGRYAVVVEGFGNNNGNFELSINSVPVPFYVNEGATGSNDGLSWTNAFTDLQDALAASTAGRQIWVAAGTYKPTTTTDRSISFQIPDSVKVYGGFAGTEATNYNLDSRDFSANETILSGDIGTQNNSTDNTHHVIFTQYVSPETLVDGFSITKGNAEGGSYNGTGGGWLNYGSGTGNSSNPTIRNIKFFNNRAVFGGGLDNEGNNGGYANPTISNCSFTSNTATFAGGAMYNYGGVGASSPILTNCTFTSNTATNGGAMYNDGSFNGTSSPTLTNCTFTSNTASVNGGAMYNFGESGTSSPTLTNCTFTSNTASANGGAMYNYGAFGTSSPILTNCILWDNMANASPNSFYNRIETGGNATVTISHSLVQETSCNTLNVGTGNVICFGTMIFNLDPQFIDADNSFLNLKCNSPAINTGTSTGAPTDDITGFARTGNPDMGAYEFGHAEVENDIASGANPILNGTPYIKASSKILNTNNALYQGARFVEMLPGFEVAPTSGQATVFRAEVGGGCTM